jgi:hypothetical protein
MVIYRWPAEALCLFASMPALHHALFGFAPYGWKQLSEAAATFWGTQALGVKAERTALLSLR